MPFPMPVIVKTGDLYWCEPDPTDTVGSEQQKDRIWVIVSLTELHRGNCVVGIPLSTRVDKAGAHLIKITKSEFKMEAKASAVDCVALTDQIRALDKRRFRKKAGTITPYGLNAVRLGLQRLLGI